MSIKGEKYSSRSAKMRHEKSEGAKERMKEYGRKPVKKAAVKKNVLQLRPCTGWGGKKKLT